MKVIICGAGQVGWQIARQLSSEKNDVTVVDNNPDLVHRATDTLDVQGTYVDPAAASQDEYDKLWAAKGNTVAVRVYPGGKATNRRYGQIIGPLKNVTVPGIGGVDTDFVFNSMVEGVVTVAKGA